MPLGCRLRAEGKTTMLPSILRGTKRVWARSIEIEYTEYVRSRNRGIPGGTIAKTIAPPGIPTYWED